MLLAVALSLGAAFSRCHAGSFASDFNSGPPAGTAVYGVSAVSPNDGSGGGITNSGCLQLMTDVGSQEGAFIISTDLDAGSAVASFTASFKAFIGSFGNGADGMSFNFAPDLPQDVIGHEGAGTGLTVEFDTYPNSPEVGATLDVKVGGSEIATKLFPGMRPGQFVDVVIQLNPDHTLDVVYDGVYAYSNLDVSAYTPAGGSLFGFGASTGGTSDNVWIDNLNIVTRTNAGAFVQSFSPRGRRVQPSSAIDIALQDSTSHVRSNTISLKVDGTTVSPAVTANGTGATSVHYAPPGPFAPYTTHSVSLVFADDAFQTNTWQYEFTIAPVFRTIFSDGFEKYASGNAPLDMNVSGPNASANGNLAGNPWFGPLPPNSRVVGTQSGVNPHSGTNMIKGSAPSDFDQNWFNLAYRLNGGNNYFGNIALDWWFYDPAGAGNTGYRDYVALGDYFSTPTDTDYPASTSGNLNPGGANQRLSLGASFFSDPTFNPNFYQARVAGADDPGIAGTGGWFNTTTARSVGWHHGRIAIGPQEPNSNPDVSFYIDDMINPTLSHNIISGTGLNVIEINSSFGSVGAYYDDITFAVAQPPGLSISVSGSNVILSWPGLGFTLQSASAVNGPYTDVTGATSPYSYDTSSGNQAYFRLRN